MKKLTLQEAQQEFISRQYIPLFNEYENNKKKLLAKTPEGYMFETSICRLKNGIKPSLFNIANKYTIENIKLWLRLNNKNYELISTAYKSATDKLMFKCSKHGIFLITWNDLHSGYGCYNCGIDSVSGMNCYRYNNAIATEEREARRLIPKYSQFLKQVYKRDNSTCQCCGNNNRNNLNVHHLNGYTRYKTERVAINNGIILCIKCHIEFHRQYGQRDNTKEQFIKFMAEFQDNKKVS